MMTLVYGASASGKSEYAESLLARREGKKIYLATMRSDTEESAFRIERHRRLRAGKGFDTVERTHDVHRVDARGSAVLLECLSNLVANELYEWRKGAQRIARDLARLENECDYLIVVGCDVFRDGMVYEGFTQDYVDALAWLQNALAQRAERVVEVVAGIPIAVKGDLP